MPSANFIVGSGLSYDGFMKYVVSPLTEAHCVVENRVELYDGLDKQILCSVMGGVDLRKALEKALDQGRTQCEEDNKIIRDDRQKVAWSHHLRDIKEIDYYEDLKTASKLFPAIAATYLAKCAEGALGRLEGEVQSLANTTLGDFAKRR